MDKKTIWIFGIIMILLGFTFISFSDTEWVILGACVVLFGVICIIIGFSNLVKKNPN